jgi:hypothetical protein
MAETKKDDTDKHLLRFPKKGVFKDTLKQVKQRMKDEMRSNQNEMLLILINKGLNDEF